MSRSSSSGRARRKDGTLFWVEVSLVKVSIGGRECLLSVMRDITQRRQEQEELRQSQARYRSIVEDQAEFLVCHFLADGTMTFVNEALCRCVGVRREELLGKTFWPFIAKEDVERLRTRLAAPPTDRSAGTRAPHCYTGWPRTVALLEQQDSVRRTPGI